VGLLTAAPAPANGDGAHEGHDAAGGHAASQKHAISDKGGASGASGGAGKNAAAGTRAGSGNRSTSGRRHTAAGSGAARQVRSSARHSLIAKPIPSGGARGGRGNGKAGGALAQVPTLGTTVVPAAPAQPLTAEPAAPASPAPGSRGERPANGQRRRPARGIKGIVGRSGANGLGSVEPAFIPAGDGATAARATTSGRSRPRPTAPQPPRRHEDDSGSLVTRTVRDAVEVVPDRLKLLVGALAGLSLMLGLGYLFFGLRAHRLDRQRRQLLQEVGLLQTALLPPVPGVLGGLRTSVAYRPADGPGAGGDFYDALSLRGGRAGFLLGDISGHGRDALAQTAFLRYTLRAYLEAGLEPRMALQVAGRVLDESLGGDFVTVILAVHDPAKGSLTYACAGHPAPLLSGPTPFRPVLAASSPPIGVGLPTGQRQTTIPLVPGSVACLFTDGMTEARTERGILGRGRLGDLLDELGRDAAAHALLEQIASEARSVPDDMACCLVAPADGVTAGGFRTEELEVSAKDVAAGLHDAFLRECGAAAGELERAGRELRPLMGRFGGAVLRVTFGTRSPSVEVLPRNVVSIEAASRRASAAG